MREIDLRKLIVGVALVALSGGTALAVPIVPGGVQFPAVAEPDPVGATLIMSTGPLPFAAATFSGTLTSSVFTNDAANPFGPNALTFTYSIFNNGGSSDSIGRMTVSSFDGFSTDASFNPAAGVPPTIITRSANGQVMGFDFVAPALAAGQTSSLLVVQTNTTQFSPTIASLIDGTTASVASFAPLPIPEPASLAAIALGGSFALRRRRP